MSLIGLHVSISGGFLKAIERGETQGCEAIQIFTKNQLQWKAPAISPSQGIAFLKALRESGIKRVVAHASYLINLAGEEPLRGKSIEALVDEIERCDHLGIEDLVLHPGAHLGQGPEKGFLNLKEGLRIVLDRTENTLVRILLETMAGQGTVIGARIDLFREVLQGKGVIRTPREELREKLRVGTDRLLAPERFKGRKGKSQGPTPAPWGR